MTVLPLSPHTHICAWGCLRVSELRFAVSSGCLTQQQCCGLCSFVFCAVDVFPSAFSMAMVCLVNDRKKWGQGRCRGARQQDELPPPHDGVYGCVQALAGLTPPPSDLALSAVIGLFEAAHDLLLHCGVLLSDFGPYASMGHVVHIHCTLAAATPCISERAVTSNGHSTARHFVRGILRLSAQSKAAALHSIPADSTAFDCIAA
jgi:hypothetical protein